MHEFRSKTFLRVLICSAIAIFACIPSYAQAACDPAAAVRLVAVDPSPAGSRTPLVLIHGIHGVPNGRTVCDGDGTYWSSFENYFSSAGLGASFKLYEVYYISDTYPVSFLGLQLRDVVDSAVASGAFPNQTFVIVAHSLGGLVARAFMASPGTIDASGRPTAAGIPEGYRVQNLITLATPHHGTLAANLAARDIFATDATWQNLMTQADHVYWTCANGTTFQQLGCAFGSGGIALTEKNSAQPDRSDLRWDFKDVSPTMTPAISGTGDLNQWLSSLNSDRTFDRSLITYAGWKTATISDPAAIAAVLNNPFAAFQMGFGEHDWLSYFVSILTYGLRGNPALPLGYTQSDGLVPDSSARFDGHAVDHVREFPGLDHLDMKESPNVFSALQTDLLAIVNGSPAAAYNISNFGGVSLTSRGISPSTTAGYAQITPAAGQTAPAGLAIFGYRPNNILVTEAGVPASPAVQLSRIYAEVNSAVNTGLAIANPNPTPVTISFYFSDDVHDFGDGSVTIPANGQIATFLNQPPFNSPSVLNGTLTMNAALPIAVVALRGITNARGEFLITTLPVADLTAPPSANTTLVFPHFVDGSGWITEIALVNPGNTTLTGSVEFRAPSGQSASIGIGGQVNNSFSYSIPPKSSKKLQTSGTSSGITTGSVRVIPSSNSAAPSGMVIFSLTISGVTSSAAGVPSVAPGTAFRMYGEMAGDFANAAVGSIQTGLAVANLSAMTATVNLELFKLDGSSTGLVGTMSVPANGQQATFLNQITGFGSLPLPFQGVLRASSTANISVMGLRGRYNERGDFLMTTTPPADESAAGSTSPLFIPHLADGGGFTTQFVLFSGTAGQSSSGTLQFFAQSGSRLNLSLQDH
jgi:hypothetical protein